MRSLKILIDLLRKPGVAARDLETAAHEADQIANAAEAACIAAEEAYQAGLLGDERTLAKLDDARRTVLVERDRTRRLADELDARLTVAVSEERRARRQAAHDAAAAQCAAIGKRLAVEYPKHAAAIRSLLHDLAEAKLAAEAANAEAETCGLPYIPDPESSVRGLDQVPEEVIARERMELWVREGQSEPPPADVQALVQRDPQNPERGILPFRSSTNAGAWDCTRRPFERVTYRAYIAPPLADTLLHAVNLPELQAYAAPFVQAHEYRGLEGTIAHLAGPAAEAPAVERPKLIRFEPLPVDEAGPRIVIGGRNHLRVPEKPRRLRMGDSALDSRPWAGDDGAMVR